MILRGKLNIEYWSNIFLLLYIFSMPFVSGFSFTPIISLSLILATLLFLLMCIGILRSLKLPSGFIGVDVLIISLILFLVSFSFIINGLGNSKSLNHTIAYLSTFLLFYVAIKFTFFNARDKDKLFRRVLQFITYTVIFNAFYANVEFISSNIFGLNLNDYIPRPNESESFYDATVLALFYRARGFAPESGHFAFMMELFSPLAIYYMYFSGFCKWRKFIKAMIIVLVIFSFLFAVSTASFAIIPLAILFACLVYITKIIAYIKKHTAKFIISITSFSIIAVLFNYFFSFYALIILSISDKLDSTSFNDRQERIDFFNDKFFHLDFIKNLVGTGPAGYGILGFDETRAILSLYYSITFELGYLGLLLLVLLFSYIIFQTLKIRSSIGFFLLISLGAGIMHYYFISNFWYPWFWFIAVFAIFCNKYITIPKKVTDE